MSLPQTNSLSSNFPQSEKKNIIPFPKESWRNCMQDFDLQQNTSTAFNSIHSKEDIEKFLKHNRKALGLNGSSFRLLKALLRCQNSSTGQCNPSLEYLADEMGSDRSTVVRAFQHIKKKFPKLLQREYYYPRGVLARRCQTIIYWDEFINDFTLGATCIRDRCNMRSESKTLNLSSSELVQELNIENEVLHKATPCASFAVTDQNLLEDNKSPLISGDVQMSITDKIREKFRNKPPLSSGKKSDLEEKPPLDSEEIEEEVKLTGWRAAPIDEACMSAADKLERWKARRNEDKSHLLVVRNFKPEMSLEELAQKVQRNVGTCTNKIEFEVVQDIPITKKSARLKRIDEIPIRYPHYQQILDREGCTLPELQARMRANDDYEPFDEIQNWNLNCHPKYALLDEKARDQLFIRAVEYWLGKPKYAYAKKIHTMFKRGREIADECRASYRDYMAALYDHYGNREIELWKIGWKTGKEVYEKWVEEGSPWPTRHGYTAKHNRECVKKFSHRPRRGGFRPKRKMEDLLEENRKVVGLAIVEAIATGAYDTVRRA